MSDDLMLVPESALATSLPDSGGVNHIISSYLDNGPVLLTIYKSSCAASKVMLPMLNRIDHKHRADGLTTLAVSQDSANISRSFARRYEIDFPILVEGSTYPISNAFEIRATPSVYLILKNRSVAYGTMGFMRDQIAEIEEAVASALEVEPRTIIGEEETEIPWFVPG